MILMGLAPISRPVATFGGEHPQDFGAVCRLSRVKVRDFHRIGLSSLLSFPRKRGIQFFTNQAGSQFRGDERNVTGLRRRFFRRSCDAALAYGELKFSAVATSPWI